MAGLAWTGIEYVLKAALVFVNERPHHDTVFYLCQLFRIM